MDINIGEIYNRLIKENESEMRGMQKFYKAIIDEVQQHSKPSGEEKPEQEAAE